MGSSLRSELPICHTFFVLAFPLLKGYTLL
jgi:hypothetical protein